MSEELEALGALDEEQLPDDIVEDQEDIIEDDLSHLSTIEKEAHDMGWRPKEEFKGDPDNWRTPLKYIAYDQFRDELHQFKNEARQKDAENDRRITNLNKLHSAQQKAAIADLEAQQLDAVEEADTVKYKQLQTQIDSHKVEPETTTPGKDPAIAAWEEANPWVNDPTSDKGQQAIALFNVAAGKPGASTQSCLTYVDEQIAKLHPDETHQEAPRNPRREAATMTETSTRRSPRQRGSKELTMSDLTRDEQKQWAQFGQEMFDDEKSYLKAVADARKEG